MMAHSGRRGWRVALNLVFAALFAFVLPLICWGAQATPGHPHARAHFVFLPPEEAPHHAGHTPAADLPSGKATPSVLAIFLLLLFAVSAACAPRKDAPGFPRLSPALHRSRLTPQPDPPPPRLTFWRATAHLREAVAV